MISFTDDSLKIKINKNADSKYVQLCQIYQKMNNIFLNISELCSLSYGYTCCVVWL